MRQAYFIGIILIPFKISTTSFIEISIIIPIKYKIYHPAFPHEPTSDQFFDNVQWESYFQLGQYIGAPVFATHSK